MLRIGLTGGIATGKSTVATYFKQLEIPVLDADQITRELLLPEGAAYQAVTQHFPQIICRNTGEIQRRPLQQLIFRDASARHWLEQLIHPLVKQTMEQQLAQLNTPYVILDIPLLFEATVSPQIDRILLVDRPPALQLKHLHLRYAHDPQLIRQILQCQIPREIKIIRANDIIFNYFDLSTLKKTVFLLHKDYLTLTK